MIGLSISIFRSLWILLFAGMAMLLYWFLSISIFRSLWILRRVGNVEDQGCDLAFQSPFSGAFESYSMARLSRWHIIKAFNLHFQEPLNLTYLISSKLSDLKISFNLHFQEPLNLTRTDRHTGKWCRTSFNLHFQEPLNLTLHRCRCDEQQKQLSISIFRSLWILRGQLRS